MTANQNKFPSDVAFTQTVKDIQTRAGSRRAYERMEQNGGWQTEIEENLTAFITAQTSFYLGTANACGQPYIQHRGGPPGFLRVIDKHTLAFADFSGNRQFISIGNLAENPKAILFLMDYANRNRIKIWGEATVSDDDLTLNESLRDPLYKAKVERSILIKVVAWDANCNQHIPQRFEAADVKEALAKRDARIAELEAELARLNQGTI